MEQDNYFKIIFLDSVESTNDYAFSLACSGQKEVTVVRAKQQTKGKGRGVNKWASAKDKGLYLSFILRPKNPIDQIVMLPLLFSYGLGKAIRGIVKPKIKWPNDVFIKDKKIAGVLVEARSNKEHAEFVVVGTGININAGKNDIPELATSLFLENNKIYDDETIFKNIIAEELALYRKFKKGNIDTLINNIKFDAELVDQGSLKLVKNNIVNLR